MKILMLVMHLPPAPCGGAEMQCWKQAKALVARGHEVTILTAWLVGRSARREVREGVTIRRVGFFLPLTAAVRRLHRRLRLIKSPPAADRPDPFSADGPRAQSNSTPKRFRWMAPVEWLGNWSFIRGAGQLVRQGKWKPDVVHVHESGWLAGLGEWMGMNWRVPVFCKEACGDVFAWKGGGDIPWRAEWLRRRPNCRFIAITPQIRNNLERAGIPGERIWDVSNGVELPELVARPGYQGAAIYAGNFSQGAVYKAFDVLLRAWGAACRQEPGMRLRLHGGGDDTRWRLIAAREGCGESVEFAGPAADLQREFREAGFLVLPSRVEGLSNVLLEAQAAGLPAVVSDIGGNVAVVQDGSNGLVVPVGDADALAAAMVRLYRSSTLRAKMGEAARARMAAEFEIGKVAARLELAYRHAVAEDVAAASGRNRADTSTPTKSMQTAACATSETVPN